MRTFAQITSTGIKPVVTDGLPGYTGSDFVFAESYSGGTPDPTNWQVPFMDFVFGDYVEGDADPGKVVAYVGLIPITSATGPEKIRDIHDSLRLGNIVKGSRYVLGTSFVTEKGATYSTVSDAIESYEEEKDEEKRADFYSGISSENSLTVFEATDEPESGEFQIVDFRRIKDADDDSVVMTIKHGSHTRHFLIYTAGDEDEYEDLRLSTMSSLTEPHPDWEVEEDDDDEEEDAMGFFRQFISNMMPNVDLSKAMMWIYIIGGVVGLVALLAIIRMVVKIFK